MSVGRVSVSLVRRKPAFPPKQPTGEKCGLVAFVERLDELSPRAYRSLIDAADDGPGHEHREEKMNGRRHS